MPATRGLYERSRRARSRAGVKAFALSDEPPEWFWKAIHGPRASTSGAMVTDQSALQIAAVLSCVRVLSESTSTLPLAVFERQADGDRRAAPEHPVHELLHSIANEESTAQTVRETLAAHVLLRGNAYAQIARDGGGDARELWPLGAGAVRPVRRTPTSRLEFEHHQGGQSPVMLRLDQVWRIPGLSWNGVTGLSPIGLARESLGVALGLEESTAAALKNGARISSVVMYPEFLDDDEFKRRSKDWSDTFAGNANTGKTYIADGNAKFEKIGMSFMDMQFLELKRFQIAEIARLFRVPLHMLYDQAAQPRANMEQASLEFVMYSLRPWLVRFEQSIMRDLFLPAERARYFAEHNVAGLLRGDFAARMAGYASARQWGWLSINDIRRLENLNGIGAKGDDYLQPINMAPAGSPAAAPAR